MLLKNGEYFFMVSKKISEYQAFKKNIVYSLLLTGVITTIFWF